MKLSLGCFLLLLAAAALADVVIPADAVENYVNIRKSPDSGADVVGRLNRGEQLEFLRTVDGWHEVTLPEGGTGYVHGDWTNVVTGVELLAVEEAADQTPGPNDVDTEPDILADVAADAESLDEPQVTPESEPLDEPQVAPEPESLAQPQVTPEPAPVAETEATIEPEVLMESGDADSTGIRGTENFLVRFKNEFEGRNSQIFDDGNFVGIGTTEPKQRLEVNGSIQIHEQNSSVAGLMITQSSGDTGYMLHNRASTLTIGAGSVDRITIDRNGNVGIAVPRPVHPLEMVSGAHVTAGGVWTNSSSREQKEGIARLTAEQARQAVADLEPVQFRYKNDDRETYVGFIAEEVPDLVATEDRRSLSAMDIVAVLTKVVQEQERRIAKLEARLDSDD